MNVWPGAVDIYLDRGWTSRRGRRKRTRYDSVDTTILDVSEIWSLTFLIAAGNQGSGRVHANRSHGGGEVAEVAIVVTVVDREIGPLA